MELENIKKLTLTLILISLLIGTASAWMAYDDRVIGIRIDTTNSNPDTAVDWIDENGDVVDLSSYNFDDHVIWGNMAKVILDPSDNSITTGTYPRGDGLDMSGSSGPVMLQVPKMWVKTVLSGDYNYYYISPTAKESYSIHPAFYQRGGTAKDWIYVGAYEAGLKVLDNGTLALDSASGVQPWTGYTNNPADGMFALGFNSGTTAPSVGAWVNGTTSGTSGILVDYYISGGSWSGDNAAGILYLRQTSGTYTNSESLTFATANTTTSNKAITLKIDEAEEYGNNNGIGYGAENFWTYSLIKLLYYTEYANLDSQSTIGMGVTTLPGGTGYAGLLTGANNIDTNIATSGTGTGTGVDGKTPVSYRNWNDGWGNVFEFNPGYTSTDAAYHILPLTGTTASTIPGVLTNYITSPTAPLAGTNYYSTTIFETPVSVAFLPNASGASDKTYYCDYYYAHTAGQSNILLSGGDWTAARRAGVGYLHSPNDASYSYRSYGARLEFLGNAERENNPVASFTPTTSTSDTTLSYPYTISFTSTSTGADWHHWDFGDGSTSTAQNPTHSYTTNGVHKVSLIAGTDAGSWDKTTGTATYDYTYTGNYGASALAYTINQNSAGLSATSSGQETRIKTKTYDTTVSISNTTTMTATDLDGVAISEWKSKTDPVTTWSTLITMLVLAAIILVISVVILYIRRI